MKKKVKHSLKADITSPVTGDGKKSRQFRDKLTRVTSPVVVKGVRTHAMQWNRWTP